MYRVVARKIFVVLLVAAIGVVTTVAVAQRQQVTHIVPFIAAASGTQPQGFLRIVNNSDESGSAIIFAIDDAGSASDELTLALGANETVGFDAESRETGAPDACRAQKSHPCCRRPVIHMVWAAAGAEKDSPSPRPVLGRLHQVYQWAVWPRMEFLRPTGSPAVYPRVNGETTFGTGPARSRRGLSPRERGNPNLEIGRPDIRRSIPA